MDTITIAKRDYIELLNDSMLLECLERVGVDNWAGWDYARDEWTRIIDITILEDGARVTIYED